MYAVFFNKLQFELMGTVELCAYVILGLGS